MPNNFYRSQLNKDRLSTEETNENLGTRAVCLYRVSTTKQVEKDSSKQLKNARIPLQERACRDFAKNNGWNIVNEYYERGVSGYKTPTAKRDVLQEIKKDAEKNKFDILLIFMFDRLGRREDETPFVLQWFVEHNIRVWSVEEGEARIDGHVDKLTNYIRFWQASGESHKTSIRVRERREQMVSDGAWGGGPAPYGYKLVHKGKMNKYMKLIYDLEINEEEARIVKDIYDKTINERMGRNAICNYLNEICRAPYGGLWKPATIARIHNNSIYTGRLKCGDIYSEPIESLRIISDEDFILCSQILDSRNLRKNEKERREAGDPTLGKSDKFGAKMLNGLVFCGGCGSRLSGTYRATRYRDKLYYQPIYRCLSKSMKAVRCTGQSAYSARQVEEVVLAELDEFMESLGEQELRGRDIVNDTIKERLASANRSLAELMRKRAKVESEILRSLDGESTFDSSNLNAVLSSLLKAIAEETRKIEAIQQELNSARDESDAIELARTNTINVYKAFNDCNTRQKNKILRQIIDKIIVYRENKDQALQVKIYFALTKQELHPNQAI